MSSLSVASLVKVFYKPSSAISDMVENEAAHGIALAIAAAFGLIQGGRFYRTIEQPSPLILIAGAVSGIAGWLFFAWLLRNFSRWFNASADLKAIRVALGFGFLPWTLLFAWLIFTMPSEGDSEAVAGYFRVFISGFFYGFIILLLALKAALNIPVVKAFLCLLLTALVSFFPLTLLAQVAVGLFG